MIWGIIASALTFVSFFICISAYYVYYRNENETFLNLARLSFYFASLLIFGQSVLLLWGIYNHQFQWQYIFSYTSRDMSTFYLTSSFWGGQEGTFLLWLMLGCFYGWILIRRRMKEEPLVMGFMVLIMAFIAMILVKKNPFSYVWDIHPNAFQAGVVPIDGNGLNPLLQDPWMIIHPPILFTGYSSTMMLFAFAMTALVTRNYNNWIKSVFPYSLFVSLALGTGIILGGYWAYTTLGWGGYWGWDPVENSSLIPWLTSLAFLHGVIIQRRQGGLKKTNIFMALLTFILVLWGSFLTRSGVLSDFSVHSFSESELNNYLILFVALFAGIAFFTFLVYTRQVKSDRVSNLFFTRETFMLFGILALLGSSVLTFFGTSAPLFTGILFGQAANVTTEYYNLLNAPIAILIGVLLSLSPVFSWKRESGEKLKGLVFHFAGALVISLIAFIIGLRDILPLLIFFAFVLVIFINGEIILRMIRKKNWSWGGYMAHVGVGFMLIGIITSSVYETTSKTTLPIGKEKEVMGYQMRYVGFNLDQSGKDEAVIDISGQYTRLQARPKFYWSQFNQAYMRNPSVHNLWVKDLYISPIQVIPPEQMVTGTTVTLRKNESLNFEQSSILFTGYEMDEHRSTPSEIKISALVEVSQYGKKSLIKPSLIVDDQNRNFVPDRWPGSEREVYIQNVDVDNHTLTLLISNPAGAGDANANQELLAVEITEKPLINLLWMGTFMMMIGLSVAIMNRVRYKSF